VREPISARVSKVALQGAGRGARGFDTAQPTAGSGRTSRAGAARDHARPWNFGTTWRAIRSIERSTRR
jgi:hypothetical protein